MAAFLVMTVRKSPPQGHRRRHAGARPRLIYSRFSSILFQISAAISAPPKFFTARMPVGELVTVSEKSADHVDADEEEAALAQRRPEPGTDVALARGEVGRLGYAAAHHVERRSSGAGTRLMAPANSPSTRMMRLSPSFTAGKNFCTTQGSRNVAANRS